MYFEIFIVILLTLLNGLFAMSELAIVTARPARLKLLVNKGSKGAATALTLAANPNRFLSSVQIGITLVGVLNGAVSGATLGARLSGELIAQGMSADIALPLGVGTVVVLITYLSLIVGELVPKQIALKAPEAVAARVAPMMSMVAQVASPLIWVLARSGQAVMYLLGQSSNKVARVSDEEVRMIIAEAESTGAMKPAEGRMIAGVMRVADRTARGLMTPRLDLEMIDVTCGSAELMSVLHNTSRSRLPVWEGEKDNVIGILLTRDILAPALAGQDFELRGLLREAPVVREGLPATEVIDLLRTAPAHMLLVYDEYGHLQGVITPMDVLQAITGEFPDETEEDPKFVTRADGSFLVAGWMPVDELAELLSLEPGAGRDYDTAAGFVLELFGRLPQEGETIEVDNWRIEVVDLDGRRIDKLLIGKRG
ncbi:hemolysin family protein [Sulfitobacter guttiformis]|uniref:Putative hemolysin n=1 Tax=Sulfitobacter guttiformis TaxID=74349 RepID=A0A420DPQ5_9RHOB|nr:hemolysin family protein [Sulfitobacter guttiformis]KIN73503.1 Hemolysin [Sulfitobacter guttiformis KCTC 32187]RKE96158.1 putative hemolysin [Sulfitobacter guttiformis]